MKQRAVILLTQWRARIVHGVWPSGGLSSWARAGRGMLIGLPLLVMAWSLFFSSARLPTEEGKAESDRAAARGPLRMNRPVAASPAICRREPGQAENPSPRPWRIPPGGIRPRGESVEPGEFRPADSLSRISGHVAPASYALHTAGKTLQGLSPPPMPAAPAIPELLAPALPAQTPVAESQLPPPEEPAPRGDNAAEELRDAGDKATAQLPLHGPIELRGQPEEPQTQIAQPAQAPPVEPALRDESQLPEYFKQALKKLTDVELSLTPPNGDEPLPVDYADVKSSRFTTAGEVFHMAGTTRPWGEQVFHWKASGLCHKPLYFEEINAERYGYSCALAQPVVSAAHFFGRIPALPYLMTAEPPCCCLSVLGHYPPGSCAPGRWPLIPARLDAGLVQAGVVTGLIFLIP